MLQCEFPFITQVHDYLKGGILYVYIKQASHVCPPCLLQVSLLTCVQFRLTELMVLQAVHLVRKARILNPIFSAKSQVKVRCHHISLAASHLLATLCTLWHHACCSHAAAGRRKTTSTFVIVQVEVADQVQYTTAGRGKHGDLT
jgi:hypothetical protein